jgi:hypothetical protein
MGPPPPNYGTISWPVVLIRLTALLRETPGYRSPDSRDRGVPVYVGPEVFITADTPSQFVVLGWPGALDISVPSGSANFEAGAIAPSRPREETGTISGKVFASTGGASQKDILDTLTTASGMVSDIDVLLRSDPTMGLPSGSVLWCFLAGTTTTIDVQGGAVVEIEFSLEYTARMAAQANVNNFGGNQW